MNLRERPWLAVAVLGFVLVMAYGMHMEQMAGWPFLILCLTVTTVLWFGFTWGRDRLASAWSRLSKPTKRITIVGAVFTVLAVTFAINRHKADEFVNDFVVVFALLLLALYRITSRFLDALHAKLFKR